MTENLQGPTSAQLEAATEKMRNNEVQKYMAAAIDRLSTAVAVVGFLGPVITVINSRSDQPLSFFMVQLMIIFSSMVLSYGLHLYGRMKLKRGLE